MKIKCKNCKEAIEFEDFDIRKVQMPAWKHVETHSIFCKTKQGQTIGTYATPEDEDV